MEDKKENKKMKLRIMNDTKNYKWWAEELIGDRWVEIPKTRMSCEANTRSCMADYLKKKREEQYRLYVKQVGEEVEFDLGF